MAKVILENTREHDITLSALDDNGELVQVTIPGARQSETERDTLIPGVAEADDAFLDAAKKKSKAVAAYFDEEYLRVVKTGKQEAKQPAGKQEAKE
jgi:hypothetical protein